MFLLTIKVSLTFSCITHFPDSTLFISHNYEQSSNSFSTFKPCSPSSSSDFLCKFTFSRLLLSELSHYLFLTANPAIDFILHLQL